MVTLVSVDLNLLVALDALLTEVHAARDARHIAIVRQGKTGDPVDAWLADEARPR